VVVHSGRDGGVLRHRAGYFAAAPARSRAAVLPQVTRTATAIGSGPQ
jgi:hypothetical protein